MRPPAQGHSHQLPRSLLALVAVCIVGLLVGIVLSYVYAQNVDERLGRLEQYVQGRGEYRDQEQRRLEEQVRRSTCDLLDQLPEGGLLAQPRRKYHCGPGIPLASLPPDVQRRYAGDLPATPSTSARPTVAPTSAAPAPSTSPRPTSPAPTTSPRSTPTLPGVLCPLLPAC